MLKNPKAVNGTPVGASVCECLHVYVQHVREMPSDPVTERQCLVEGCDCAQFIMATDAQVVDVEPLSAAKLRAEYVRAGAARLLSPEES